MEAINQNWANKRVRTPTVIQMEAMECGAASLAMILAFYKRFVPLEELRVECGVSRDGSKAANLLKAARKYGLEAKGFNFEIKDLQSVRLPCILFWNFNHYVVLEGIRGNKVYLNDPAVGPRSVSLAELDECFTGVTLGFTPDATFKPSGTRKSIVRSLWNRSLNCRPTLLFVTLVGLMLVIPGLIIPSFTSVFIDNVLVRHMDGWFKPLLVGMALMAILNGILIWLQQMSLLRLETWLALTSARDFFRHVFRLPVVFFAQRFAGDIASRVMLNDKIAALLSGQLASTFVALLTIPFYAVLMFHYDSVLSLVSVCIAAFNLVVLRYVSRRRMDLNQRLQQESGKLIGVSMSGLQMIESLKASGGESDFYARWSGTHAKVVNASQELGLSTEMMGAIPPLLMGFNSLVILSVGGLRVIDGHMSMGLLVAFQGLMANFMMPVNQLIGLGGVLQETVADVNRLDDVLRYPQDPRVTKAVDSQSMPVEARLKGFLELRHVTFGYNKLEAPLLTDFSIKLNPGQRVALVGASGSGKSTVAKLVAALYEPWEGEILLDGKNIQEIPREVFANSVAFVDQDLFLFEGSVHDNVSLWDGTMPDKDVIGAATDAAIHDEVAQRIGGYGSSVAEGGQNFSGGQRQRLEIARAFALNPSILIMDEATSALDSLTEKKIDDAIRRRGCTCLIIAHRLSTIRDADEIILLEAGRVVQRGIHDELKNQPGPYAGLIKME